MTIRYSKSLRLSSLRIGNKLVGEKHPCYIIAEIGSNFDGSLIKAKKLIKLAKQAGADCAKFQSFLTKELLSPTGFKDKITFQAKWKKSVWNIYEDAELPRKWHKDLSRYADTLGIHFMFTPYDYAAVDILEENKTPAYKIGSGDITYLDFLKYIARKRKTILLPTGASTITEIRKAINIIKKEGNNNIILLQSVTQYPTPIDEANINAMVTLKKKFHYDVGYSDHSPGILIPIASVALGACVIEKHFTDNPKNLGPDHPHSLDPTNFSDMVKKIRDLEKALGDGIKKVEKSEKHTRIIQRRSVYTIKKIKKGERFDHNNIKCLRPAIGVSASKFNLILKKRAKKDLVPYLPLKENRDYN